jgi:WD40 repeat protein
MMSIEHRLTRRSWSTRVWRSMALGLLLAGLLSLAGASSAPAGIPYTFTPVAGSPWATGFNSFPNQVVFSPNGGLLATNTLGAVELQSVSTGGAVSAPTAPQGGGECKPNRTVGSDSVAFSPNGAVLAEAVSTGFGTKGVLHTYSVSGEKLTADACLKLGTEEAPNAYSVAFSPASEGGLLAVTNTWANNVSVFTVTGKGKVHAIPGSPFATGKEPVSVAFSPGGAGFGLLATANSLDNTVSVFTVGSGTVAPVAGSPFAIGKQPCSVAFSPSGALLATADQAANQVSVFSVSFTGTLTQVAGSPFATDNFPSSVAFSPDGALLATANTKSDDLSLFSVSSGGALSQVSGSPLKTGNAPHSIAFSPDGFLLAVANYEGRNVAVFSYGQSLVVALPPWLSARIAQLMQSLGLGLDTPGIKPLIGQALEQVNWGHGRTTATVHLVSTSTLPSGRTINVPMLVFRAHSVIHRLQIVRRHKLKPGSHVLVVTATAPGVRSTPLPLQVNVVG